MNRKFFLLTFLVLPVLLCRESKADGLPGGLTIAAACHILHSPQGDAIANAPAPKASLGFWGTIHYIFHPEQFVQPVLVEPVINPVMVPQRQVLVFTLGVAVPQSAADVQTAQDFHFEHETMARNLKSMRATKDESSCQAWAKSSGLTDTDLQNYVNDSQIFHNVQDSQLSDYNAQNAKAAIAHYSDYGIQAKVIPLDKVEDAVDLINSLPVGKYDLVFEFHADSDGRLYDSEKLVILRSFFPRIAAQTASIAYFSCFPDKVAEYYADDFKALSEGGVAVIKPIIKGVFAQVDESPIGLLTSFLKQHAELLLQSSNH